MSIFLGGVNEDRWLNQYFALKYYESEDRVVNDDNFRQLEQIIMEAKIETYFQQQKSIPKIRLITYDESRDCGICLKEITAENDFIVVDCCRFGHIFHNECISDYISKENCAKECPTCGNSIEIM